MFWNKNKKGGVFTLRHDEIVIQKDRLPTYLPMPPKKEFSIMRELLDDAIKYDNKGNPQIRDKILNILQESIESFKINADETNTKRRNRNE